MKSRTRLTALLVGGYVIIVIGISTAVAAFVHSAGQHVGADYTAYASNLVRGQQETAELRHAIRALVDHPTDFHQQHILRILATIEGRESTTRNGLERSPLEPSAYAGLLEEFDEVMTHIPRLRELARDAVDDSEARTELRDLGLRVEDSLAYVYSELHQLNHQGAADQQRLMDRLSTTVIVLAGLLLVFIGVLLWTLRHIAGQKERLERLTVTDALTGLPNRRALLQYVEQMLPHGVRENEPVSLALVDIDYFKAINDDYGHPVGDAVLRLLAQHLQGLVRASDFTARMGGEEFGVVMPATGAGGARELCERLRSSIEALSLPVPHRDRRLTASIGVTTAAPGEAISFNTLYILADRALYEAKEQGRNRVVSKS